MLKQLNANKQEAGKTLGCLSTKSIKELFKQSNFTKEIDIFSKEYVEEQAKIAQALAKIKRQLQFLSGNVSANAVKQLTGAGFSLEKITLSMLNTAMKEIDMVDYSESVQNRASKVDRIEITKKLNVVHYKLESIKNLDEQTMFKLVKDEKPLTLDNIYIAKHSNAKANKANNEENIESKAITSEQDKELDKFFSKELLKLFERENIPKNDFTLQIAKSMIKNDISINRENMDKVIFLSDIEKNVNNDLVIQKAIENIVMHENPSDVDVYALYNDAKQKPPTEVILENTLSIIEILPHITEQTIDLLSKQHLPINLKNIRLAYEGKLDKATPYNAFKNAREYNVDAQTAKLQIMEIQSKLTHEAAFRLAKNGIEIDTLPLKQALNELRTLQREDYEKALRLVGASDKPENVSQMEQLYEMLRQSNPLTNNVFAEAISNQNDFSVTSIYNSVRTAQTLKDFETFATVPNPKFKDSFSKLHEQFYDLLNKLEIKATEQNVKAAEILSKNNINITEENILQVKAIDAKIEEIFNRLHPNIAASIIKDGHNPAKMHVNRVIEYIDDFNEQYGDNLQDKIPEFIAEMDKDKTLTEDERNSVIAIYRMLSGIQKDGAASIGVAFKNNADLTLGSLFEASKHFKRKQQKNYMLDESFGEIERIIIPENNIKNILTKTEKITADYYNLIGKSIYKNAHPANLKKLFNEFRTNDELLSIPIDELSQKLENISQVQNLENLQNLENNEQMQQTQQQMEQIATQIKNGLNVPEQLIYSMQKNNIPLTILNIGLMKQLSKNPFFVGEAINELKHIGNIKDSVLNTSLSKLIDEEKTPDEIIDNVSETLSEALEQTESASLLKQIRLAQNAIKVQKYTQKQNSLSFKLPIALNDKISNLNMYVLNKDALTSDNAELLISLDMSKLGNVQIYTNTLKTGDENTAKLRVVANTKEALEQLKNNVETLKQYANEAGFNVLDVEFELGGAVFV